jgi:L-aminopeptidase/D-esterase-like protein
MHVEPHHAVAALEAAASGPVAEGSVGGGNGMIAYEFKGGTGTASRVVGIGGADYTIGALVQANHGIRPWLTVLGRPVGQDMTEGRLRERETGSIIVVVGTDAPLSALSLRHVAKRAAIGIGRGGTPGGNSSGDIFLSFSVADPMPMPQQSGPLIRRTELNGEGLDPLYLATVEAVEEAVVNALVAGEDAPTFKPPGKVARAIDTTRLAEMFR